MRAVIALACVALLATTASAISGVNVVRSALASSIAQDVGKVSKMAQMIGANGEHVLVLLEPARPNRFGNDHEVHVLTKDANVNTGLIEQQATVQTTTQVQARAQAMQSLASRMQSELISAVVDRLGAEALEDNKSFWGVNMVSLRSSPDLVSFLAERQDVFRVEAAQSVEGQRLMKHALKLQDHFTL